MIKAAAKGERSSPGKRMHKKSSVLIVDDESLIVYSVSAYLAGRGVAVKGTTSPEEALSMIENERFDIVVTDLRMGPVSGIDIIRHLRSMGSEVKVVVMSAYFEEYEKELRELKVDALLEKPFELSRLLEVISVLKASLISAAKLEQ